MKKLTAKTFALLAALAITGVVLWNVQPFIGHGSEEYDEKNDYEYMEKNIRRSLFPQLSFLLNSIQF